MKNYITLGFICWAVFVTNGQNVKDSLTLQLTAIAERSQLPGFSVAIVSKDTILYSKGFGFADLENTIPFSEKTILNIGSVTKTLIGVSLMQLVEAGRISMSDNINDHLPFKVVHPHYPEATITIRQLATHTSSLTDGKDDLLIERSYLFQGPVDFKAHELPQDYYPYFQIYKENKDIPMGQFLKDAYAKGGKFYSEANFLNEPPGSSYAYSNLGATLLAYIVEQITQTSFADYTTQSILLPLRMKNSYWKINQIPQGNLASHYLSNGLLLPNYELITYPDGGLFTNVDDFSLYLIDMIKGINGEGKLLKESSYKELMSNQLNTKNFPNTAFTTSKGIMWSVNKDGDNISMNGADPGIVTYTLFTTKGNVGIVFFTNKSFYGNDTLEPDFRKIRATLFQNVRKLLK
ncbi:MAG: serine hydrolase domain-containing protein [Bacteroidota bacterium]